MNDDELAESLRQLRAAMVTALQHRVSLDFKCAKCGQTVYKTMRPATAQLPFPTFSVGCRCALHSYTEDPEMTAESWADLRRRCEKGQSFMTIRYNEDTDSLGVFFGNEVPSPLFEQNSEYPDEAGLLLLSDDEYHWVGITILNASEQMPAKSSRWTNREVAKWIEATYPHLAKRHRLDVSRN